MTITTASPAWRTPNSASGLDTDRRRYVRFPLTLLGRFMRASKHEFPCKLVDISVGGANIASPVVVAEGERIVAYFDHLGGIEGNVLRVHDGGFILAIHATQHKREKLAAQITWLVNRKELDPSEARRHDRVPAIDRISQLTLAEGIIIQCRVLDISLSGASIATEARPPFGAQVMLGKLRGRVVRHHEQGIGIQFLDIQEPEALRKHFS